MKLYFILSLFSFILWVIGITVYVILIGGFELLKKLNNNSNFIKRKITIGSILYAIIFWPINLIIKTIDLYRFIEKETE